MLKKICCTTCCWFIKDVAHRKNSKTSFSIETKISKKNIFFSISFFSCFYAAKNFYRPKVCCATNFLRDFLNKFHFLLFKNKLIVPPKNGTVHHCCTGTIS